MYDPQPGTFQVAVTDTIDPDEPAVYPFTGSAAAWAAAVYATALLNTRTVTVRSPSGRVTATWTRDRGHWVHEPDSRPAGILFGHRTRQLVTEGAA